MAMAMEDNRMDRPIIVFGSRDYRERDIINNRYPARDITFYTSLDDKTKNIDDYIDLGYEVVIIVFDLYSYILNSDKQMRSMMTPRRGSRIGSQIPNSNLIALSSDINNMIDRWVVNSNLYIKYRDSDVTTIEYILSEFDRDLFTGYSTFKDFKAILKRKEIRLIHNEISNTFIETIDSISPVRIPSFQEIGNNIKPAITNESGGNASMWDNYERYKDKFDNNLDNTFSYKTQVSIYIQDIEDIVGTYLEEIFKQYPPDTRYFIYDVGSLDHTYDTLMTLNLDYDIVMCHKLERSSISIAIENTNIISKSYIIAYPNVVKHQKSTAIFDDTQTIESFCTVSNGILKYETDILIKSIRYHHDQPILILCDADCKEHIESKNYNGIYFFDMGDITDIDIMKLEVLHHALDDYANTMLLDSNVIVIKKMHINSTAELILTPSYLDLVDNTRIAQSTGHMNMGHMFVANVDIIDHLDDIYGVFGKFNVDIFGPEYNVGLWRNSDRLFNSDTVSAHIHIDPLHPVEYDDNGLPMEGWRFLLLELLTYVNADLCMYISEMYTTRLLSKIKNQEIDAKYTYILLSKVNVGRYSSNTENMLYNSDLYTSNDNDDEIIYTRNGPIPIDEYYGKKFDMFEAITYSTVVNQTDTNFTWILICDINTPDYIKARLRGYERDHSPKIKIEWTDEDFFISRDKLVDMVSSEITDDDNLAVTAIIDIDDGISKTFIETIKDTIVYPNDSGDGKHGAYILSSGNRDGIILDDDMKYSNWCDLIPRNRYSTPFQFSVMVEPIDRQLSNLGIYTSFICDHPLLGSYGRIIPVENPRVVQCINKFSLYNGDMNGISDDHIMDINDGYFKDEYLVNI